jgi:hypothetical protein
MENQEIKYFYLDTIPNLYDTEIRNHFWKPNQSIVRGLYQLLDKKKIKEKIIDVGCGLGDQIFPNSTHILDKDLIFDPKDKIFIDFDLDFDVFQFEKGHFNFVYCRHTLEDIQNPQHAFQEITKLSKSGYIETPSPMVELSKYVDCFIGEKLDYRGYIHHRYIVWSDYKTNTIYFLPKLSIIEHLTFKKQELYNGILNLYPIYWNNYYYWDQNKIPNIVVYRHGLNYDIKNDYIQLLNIAVEKSMEYTRNFMIYLQEEKVI